MDVLKREFDISDVLSVTTGALVSTRHMDGIYDIIGYVTGDPEITTVGLSMMADSAKETILKQHPDLTEVTFPNIDNVHADLHDIFITKWLDEQKKRFGEKISIAPTDIPLAMSIEEQSDYVKGRNPNIQILETNLGEPDLPKRRPSSNGHKPSGTQPK